MSMDDKPDLLTSLEVAIASQRESIELNELAKLKEQLGIFQTYYENLYNILIRKSLIQEDPYKYDEKISEVTVPSSDAYLDSDKQEQLSQRLSSFHTQLEFLNNYYQFSFEFLNLKRLKNITGLMKYINWSSVTPSSTHLMTRSIAEMVAKIKLGSDHLSSQIINDAITQIERNLKTIFSLLDVIVAHLREAYKLNLRKNVLPYVTYNPKDDHKDIIKAVKKEFPARARNEQFYPELIEEILNEDLAENSAELQNDLLSRLSVKSQKPKKVENKKSFKTILLQGTRILASSGFQLEDAINKLNENNLIYKTRKMGLVERFARWVKRMASGKEDNQTYEIDFFDITTSATKTEKINFAIFIEELQKKAKLYATLSNKASSTYCRLEGSTDAKIYEFLNRNIAQLQMIHRRLSGLNDFFKSETPKEKKNKIRPINLEINAVKNSIIKSNKKKHEYVDLKEEQEQMKRLGIQVEE